jgi:hypothetical protein
MTRKCPHCKAKVGQLANTCWKCKLPLDPSKTLPVESGEVSKKGSRKGLKIVAIVITVIVIVSILAVFILNVGKQSGIEIKVFYDGPWEGTVMFYDTFSEMDAKVESGAYDEVSGSGNKVLTYTVPDKKYLSASFWATDGGGYPIKIEVWVNGKFAIGTDEDYGLPNYFCTVNLDQYV